MDRKELIKEAVEKVKSKYSKSLQKLKEVEELEREGWSTTEAWIIVKERENEDEGKR